MYFLCKWKACVIVISSTQVAAELGTENKYNARKSNTLLLSKVRNCIADILRVFFNNTFHKLLWLATVDMIFLYSFYG